MFIFCSRKEGRGVFGSVAEALEALGKAGGQGRGS